MSILFPKLSLGKQIWRKAPALLRRIKSNQRTLTSTYHCGNVCPTHRPNGPNSLLDFIFGGLAVSSTKINFQKSVNLNAILIDKSDLLKLYDLINKAFTGESDISFDVKTEYDNVKINTKSVDDLLLINGLPDKLEKLDLLIYQEGKFISITLAPYRSHLSVSGDDETWVLGIFHKLIAFFNDKRPWYHSLKIVVMGIYGLIVLMGGVTIYLFIYNYLVLPICFIIIILFQYSLLFKLDKYLPPFELRLSPQTNIINKETIIIIIAVLTLFATVIGIIVPLLSKK